MIRLVASHVFGMLGAPLCTLEYKRSEAHTKLVKAKDGKKTANIHLTVVLLCSLIRGVAAA